MALFEIRNLTFTYPEQKRPALKAVSINIQDGEFIVICGKSGCGKTTLLRHLKTAFTPFGEREGEILFCGKPLAEAGLREQSSGIGYVLQNPDNQIVTDKVWHELAFGLESLGYNNRTIRLRVAEMASFFGIQTWFHKNVAELSGGQKQLLNLASIMAMQPKALILDEPTSQLDPIAAADFLATVRKINREIGTAVIMSEHRLEETFPMADRAVVMEDAQIIADGHPKEVYLQLKESHNDMYIAMPAPMQIYAAVPNRLECPVTVREGRRWLSQLYGEEAYSETGEKPFCENGTEVAVRLKDVWFRYEKTEPDVVKDLSLEVHKGELFCIVGGNGTGKTTALSIIGGINRAYRGRVQLYEKNIEKYTDKELFSGLLGVLPQNPQCLFVEKTVKLDLLEMLDGQRVKPEEREARALAAAETVEITRLLPMHPYDLSGGEQQRAALAKVLLLNPQILLLDEPTKGLDGFFKKTLANILSNLKETGVTIIMVSHDIEFCAEYADRCAMFFDGSIVAVNTPELFFSGNSFYTTAANRMARHIFPDAVTVEDVIKLCNRKQQIN